MNKRHRYMNGYGNYAETHERLDVKRGYHFKYRGDECRVRSDGNAILVFDYEFGDWIKPSYRELQLEYVIEHKEEIQEFPIKKWHVEWDEPIHIINLKRKVKENG